MIVPHPQQQCDQFPPSSFIVQIRKIKFSTLHQAIKLIHSVTAKQGTHPVRYKLKSFDGKNIHLFQCCTRGCRSHIIFRSQKICKPRSVNKIEFEVQDFQNNHNHFNAKNALSHGHVDGMGALKFLGISDIQKVLEEKGIKLGSYQYIRHKLRRYELSNNFRDYLNKFSGSNSNCSQGQLPFILPQILRSKPMEVGLRVGFKCLNQKKKTYFFVMEVIAFGGLFTQVKFITCVKNKNPEFYIYVLSLIYIVLNYIQNCCISIEASTLKLINDSKQKTIEPDALKDNSDHQRTINFIMCLQKDFFVNYRHLTDKEKSFNQGHYQKHYLQNDQRTNDRSKYCAIYSEQNLYKSFESTDQQKNRFGLGPQTQKIELRLNQLGSREVKQIRNKCIVAQSSYKQATVGKNREWHICEQKPSLIQKLNDKFQIQQKIRLKKQKNKDKFLLVDSNYLCISSDEQKQQKNFSLHNQQSEYLKTQQVQYLDMAVSQAHDDSQFKDLIQDHNKNNKLSMKGQQKQQNFQVIQIDKIWA